MFRYTAISQSGDKIEGEMEARGREAVIEQLHDLGHLPVNVGEAADARRPLSATGLPFVSGAPSHGQITLFTRELAMLIKAGQTLDQALGLLRRDTGSQRLSRLLRALHEGLGSGQSLSDAMKRHARAFPPVYTAMVRAAEASGTLDGVLERIAGMREQTQKLRAKALSAMLYPALLILTALGAVVVMMVFVVPRFKQMIQSANSTMPDSARLIIASSDWLIANGVMLVLILAGLCLALAVLVRRPAIRRAFDAMALHLPIVGRLYALSLTVRFCKTLGTLLENGVDLPVAISLTRDVMGSGAASSMVLSAHEALRKGQSFTGPLEQAGIFPPAVVNVLRVGEETGGLASGLLYLAQMFEDKLELGVQRLFTILEPVIIILVSLFVASIIISILSAVISVNDLVI